MSIEHTAMMYRAKLSQLRSIPITKLRPLQNIFRIQN